MGLSTPQGQRTQRPIPPVGLHPAICYAIIDMGTHTENFKGNVSEKPKVKLCFEFPTLPEVVFDETKGPQRLSIMQDYNLYSDDKSNLIKMLKQWRGVQKIDLAKDLPAYLGQPCQIMVVHTTKDDITYVNIASSGTMVMPPMPQNFGPAKNPLVLFDIDKFSWAAFQSLWPFIQTKIRASKDWSGIVAKHGPEPQQGQQQTMQPNQQFVQQQPVQQYQQTQFAQPQQQVINTAAPSFEQHVNQGIQNGTIQPHVAPAPQFHSGHNPNLPPSGPNTQQFAPQTVESVPSGPGIVIGNGTPPAF